MTDRDIVRENGGPAFMEGREALKQRARRRLAMFEPGFALTEDRDLGWQEALGERLNEKVLLGLVRDCLLADPEITAILELSVTQDAAQRKINVEVARASTVYGEIAL